MSNNFAAHESCRGCSGGPSPGVKAYAAYAEDAWPYQTSMGIYNCRYIGGTTTYSKHACGDAYDQGIPTESNGQPIPQLGDPVVEALAANGVALGISQIIYNRKIYDRRSPNGRTYRGRHPHYNHLHISFTHGAGQNLTYAYIASVLGNPNQTGEEAMLELTPESAPEDIRSLQGRLNTAYDAGLKEDTKWGSLTAAAVQNNLLDFTGSDEAGNVAVQEGKEVNARMWNGLLADLIKAIVGSGSGEHPDSDHASLATKSALVSHTRQELSGPHS